MSPAVNDPAEEQLFAQAVQLHEAGRLAQAVEHYFVFLQRSPNNVDALHNLAIVFYQCGHYDKAVVLTEQVVRLRPELAVARNSLSVALRRLGRLVEAEAACREAITRQPDYAEAHNTLGDILIAQRRWQEARAACVEALRLQPDYAQAWNNLAIVLMSEGRLKAGEACCRRALRLDAADVAAWINLGNALAGLKREAEAVDCFEQALRLRPDDADVRFSCFQVKQKICDWSDYTAAEAAVREGVASGRVQGVPSAVFSFLGCTATPQEQLDYARQAAAAVAVPASARLPARATRPGGRIRLGYVSGNFHIHPVAHLIAGLIEHHDRGRFEVIGYGFDEDDGSAMRRRLTAGFDRFVDIAALSDEAAARRIHGDRIDVLVDLHGWTPDCRAKIFAYRPAPVQVNYLGYPGTTGADFMDYIIADEIVLPTDHHRFYTETVVYLPCYQCNDDRRAVAEHTPARGACGLPERGFVYCCFNNNYKITPQLFDIWMRLLRATPGSVLWLYRANALVRANLAREAEARGVAAERLVFAERVPQAEHLARHRLADLFLDTLPYNAHTTASDALWAGLPLLTCTGETFAGRVASSLLQALGLDELVTTSLEEYEHTAFRLAHDGERLRRLRARLAENRQTGELFNTARYTRRLEAAFGRMWEARCAGLPPAAFSVAA